MFVFAKESNKGNITKVHDLSSSPVMTSSIHLTFSPKGLFYFIFFTFQSQLLKISEQVAKISICGSFFPILCSPNRACMLPIKTGYHLTIIQHLKWLNRFTNKIQNTDLLYFCQDRKKANQPRPKLLGEKKITISTNDSQIRPSNYSID